MTLNVVLIDTVHIYQKLKTDKHCTNKMVSSQTTEEQSGHLLEDKHQVDTWTEQRGHFINRVITVKVYQCLSLLILLQNVIILNLFSVND